MKMHQLREYMKIVDGDHAKEEEIYEGYNENDITFAPDGSLVRIIRTHVNYNKQELAPSSEAVVKALAEINIIAKM